jgi:uncharacterized membrane protein
VSKSIQAAREEVVFNRQNAAMLSYRADKARAAGDYYTANKLEARARNLNAKVDQLEANFRAQFHEPSERRQLELDKEMAELDRLDAAEDAAEIADAIMTALCGLLCTAIAMPMPAMLPVPRKAA